MGYQVGNQCFADRALAENHYFSLVAPSISADGKIYQPEYDSAQKAWHLNGQRLTAKLPECDPAANFVQGAEAGWLVFGIAASLYFVLILKRLLR